MYTEKHRIDHSHFKCIKDLKKPGNEEAHSDSNLRINEAKKKLRAVNLDENDDRRMCMEMLEIMEKMGICTIEYLY